MLTKQKKYKTKLKHDMAEGLHKLINDLLQQPVEADDDKLVMGNLAEVFQDLGRKLAIVQAEYKITLSPPQAIAMRILYNDYVTNAEKSSMGNKLRQIADDVHKQYSI
jgi:hypothetical protein